MFSKPLLAFTGVAALSALAFAPLVNPGTVASADGKARAAAAGMLGDEAAPSALTAAERLTPLGCVAEMAGPFNCNNVDLVDNVPTPLFGGEGHGSDSWGWTDDNDTPDDPSDDTDYVIVTTGDGHGFFRLADDSTAEYLGTLPRKHVQDDGSTPILWNDVKVVNDHAYITAEDDGSEAYGVQIVDLDEVAEMEPTDPTTGLVTIEEDGHLGPNLAGHNLVAWEEIGVMGVVLGEDADCGGQLVFFDVSETPTKPQRLGCVDPDLPGIGNVPIDENEGLLGGRIDPHDAHCVVYAGPDEEYNGGPGPDGVLGTDDDVPASHICAMFGQEAGGMYLVDVSDITRDRTVDLTDGGKGGEVINRFTYETMHYAHQGWFTDDHEFVMWGDELDESGSLALAAGGNSQLDHNTNTTTYWVDVSDLDVGIKQEDPDAIYGPNPALATQYRVNEDLVGAWSNPNTTAIDHNMYPVGNFVYQANYGAGLRVLEFSPESLRDLENQQDAFTEVAYFDTYPGPDAPEFYGAWNVFPFHGHDRVILSDFEAGLLVLDVHDEVFEDDEG